MEYNKSDLFYCITGWHWHYDSPGRRFIQPLGKHNNLISENQDDDKLMLFTNYYMPLKVNLNKDDTPVSEIIKLWEEFEIFYQALELYKSGKCPL